MYCAATLLFIAVRNDIMKKTDNMPEWVYWGLWGIGSRKVAWGFLVFSVLLTLVAIPIGVLIREYSFFLVIAAPVWYWFSIRWADKNDAW